LGPVIDNLPYDIDLVWDMPFYPEDNVAINAMIMETGVKINTWKEYHDYVLDNILFCNCSEKDKNKYIKEHQKEITSRFRG
ncbi:MAG: hypothetical protein RSC43_01270, partial [Clostridia bacterium]